MGSSAPSPRLTKSTALAKAQALTARVQSLVPTLTTTLSPTTVYQPGVPSVAWGTGASGTGNVLLEGTGTSVGGGSSAAGVWVAPDVNGDGSSYQVQVECLGGGGGGGGGSPTTGGGGGGGGEYAAEPSYSIVPGKSYVWAVGAPSSGGSSVSSSLNAPGIAGQPTVFDMLGEGLPAGVFANGGKPGDAVATGTGGAGGTGSPNTVHYSGGAGGTVASGIGSDNPLSLANVGSLWVNGGASNFTNLPILGWYMMADNIPYGSTNGILADYSDNFNDATINRLAGPAAFYTRSNPAPAQVPTFTSKAGAVVDNNTLKGNNGTIPLAGLTTTTCNILLPAIGFSGLKYATISAWIQQSPQGGGVWSNTAPGSWGTIAANCASSGYTGTGNITGFALGVVQVGTASAPQWAVQFKVGNGSVKTIASNGTTLSTSGWNHVVATFNAGAMALYVNGVLVASGTATITTIPGTPYTVSLCSSPDGAHGGGYIGYMSGVWFANDVLLAAGVAQAYGSAPATGGAGGGASGSPGGNGGTGGAPGGATGGTGGNPAAVPAALAASTTPGNAGSAGANGGSTNNTASSSTGSGGGGSGGVSYGGTGGATSFYFPTAATYNGTDAQGGAASGALFNPNQQGTSSVLFTGAGPNDYDTGAKNTMLIMDPAVYALLGFTPNPGSSIFNTTAECFLLSLTVFNANPGNPDPVILEISYSYDTSLPGSYTGSTPAASPLGVLVIPAGAASATIDLTQTLLRTELLGLAQHYPSRPGAIILGPGPLPVNEAYGAPAAAAFNCEIYGPGALDSSGNSLAPYLTVTYAPASGGLTNGSGAAGAPGGLLVSYVSPQAVPVAGVNAYANTDSAGTQWAAGFTGPAGAFDPTAAASGTWKPETWHTLTPASGWTAPTPLQYKLMPDNTVMVTGLLTVPSSPANPALVATLPNFYLPARSESLTAIENPATPYTAVPHVCSVSTAGAIQVYGALTAGNSLRVYGRFPLDS